MLLVYLCLYTYSGFLLDIRYLVLPFKNLTWQPVFWLGYFNNFKLNMGVIWFKSIKLLFLFVLCFLIPLFLSSSIFLNIFNDSILAPLLGYFIHWLILIVAIEIILCILTPLQPAFKYLFPLLIICTFVMFHFYICYKHHNTLLWFLLHAINSLLKWLQCWENLFYISHIFIISDVLCRSKVSSDIIFFCLKYFFSYFFK